VSTVFVGTVTVNSVQGNFYYQQCLGGALTYLFNKVLQNAAANFCHLLADSAAKNHLTFIHESSNMDTIIFSLLSLEKFSKCTVCTFH
jgi:hypothetical protein